MLRLSIFFLFAFQSAFGGGGWTLPKKGLYSQVAFTYLKSHKLFNGVSSSTGLRRDVMDITLQAHIEYGLADKVNLILSVPVKFTATGQQVFETPDFSDTLTSGKLNFLGNLTFGGKYRILNKKWVLSAQLLIEALTSKRDFATGLQIGYNSWGILPSLATGTSWKRHYVAGELGIYLRTNHYSERLLGSLEYGYKLKKKVILIGSMSWQFSFRNGTYDDKSAVHTGLYVNDLEHFSYGMKTIIPFSSNMGLNAALFGSIYGKWVMRFPAVTIGIYYKRPS